jgi:hypothetical protein
VDADRQTIYRGVMSNESGVKKDSQIEKKIAMWAGVVTACAIVAIVLIPALKDYFAHGHLAAAAATAADNETPKNGHYENGVPVIEDSRDFWCERKFQGECNAGLFQSNDMEHVKQVACVDYTDRMTGSRTSACYKDLNDCGYKRSVDSNVSNPTMCTVIRHKETK